MKKIMIFALFVFFLVPVMVNADGYIKEEVKEPIETTPPIENPSDTNNQGNDTDTEGLLEEGNERIQQYRSRIERQEVKGGNEKKGNTLPLVLTVIAIAGIGGGYYYYQKKKANF